MAQRYQGYRVSWEEIAMHFYHCGILMKIITLFTIQDYLQDTIDKINIRNFIKIQNHV